MPKSRRISVRPGDELREQVQKAAKEAGTDKSTIVRQALEAYFAGAAPNGSGSAKRPLAPPEEIDCLLQHFRSIVDRDIRNERDRLYRALLAASFVCKQNFPRTPYVHEAYIELRHLAEFFGIQENV